MGGIDFISTLLSACVGTIGRLYLLHREKKTKRKVRKSARITWGWWEEWLRAD